MADVFISYKKEDRERVAPIVEALRLDGFGVWWDQDIEPGAPWDETIAQQIESARCVVVIWSSLSITAPWVKEEAGHGKARSILVPVRIHDVDPPLGFGLIQTADLRLWKGDRGQKVWQDFTTTIKRVLQGEIIGQLAAPMRRKQMGLPLWAALLGVAAAAAIALFIAVSRGPDAADSQAQKELANRVQRVEQQAQAQTKAALSREEQGAWEGAVLAKSRAGYEAYLAAFPSGHFLPEARAKLATCRIQTDTRYEPFEQRANVLGVSIAGSFGSREEALLSARDQGRQRAEERCAALAEGIEDVRTSSQPVLGPPQCQPLGPTQFTCSQQFWVTCTGRKPISGKQEICD
jgi:hypothetical protein